MASLAPLSNQQSSLASTHTCQVGKSIFRQRWWTEKCTITQLCSTVTHSFTPFPKRPGDLSSGDPGDKGETPTRETLQSHGGLCLRLAHLDTAIFIHFSGLFRTFTLLSLNHFSGLLSYWKTNLPPEPQFSCRRSQIHLQDLMMMFFTILPHPEWP